MVKFSLVFFLGGGGGGGAMGLILGRVLIGVEVVVLMVVAVGYICG